MLCSGTTGIRKFEPEIKHSARWLVIGWIPHGLLCVITSGHNVLQDALTNQLLTFPPWQEVLRTDRRTLRRQLPVWLLSRYAATLKKFKHVSFTNFSTFWLKWKFIFTNKFYDLYIYTLFSCLWLKHQKFVSVNVFVLIWKSGVKTENNSITKSDI